MPVGLRVTVYEGNTLLKSGLNSSTLSISICLDYKEFLGFGWIGNLYLWEAMAVLSRVLRTFMMLFSEHF